MLVQNSIHQNDIAFQGVDRTVGIPREDQLPAIGNARRLAQLGKRLQLAQAIQNLKNGFFCLFGSSERFVVLINPVEITCRLAG